MSTKPDAVFVGAGHNSLACACHLASKGWKVALYEQASEPGGAVKSGEYTIPGFRHDWAAMNLSLFAGSAFHTENAEELANCGLGFAPTGNPFSSLFPDGRWLGISNNPEITTARIEDFSEADAATWRELTENFPSEADAILAVLGSSMNLRAISSLGWKLWRKRGGGGTLDLARFLTMSPRAWLDETFENDHVKATLAAWGMHLDFAPDVAGGAVFPYLEAMAGQAFGMVLGQSGADTMINAMVRMIEKKGGEIHCNQTVTEIQHHNGVATGITLSDGSTVEASKVVIASVTPSAMTRLTGGTSDGHYNKGLENFQHAPGTMMIHLAMEALPSWPVPELTEFAYVHLAPSMDQMARTYAQAKAGLLPDEPVIVCGQPTVVDPSRAPDGKHVLWLQVRMAPGQIKGDSETDEAGSGQDSAEEQAEAELKAQEEEKLEEVKEALEQAMASNPELADLSENLLVDMTPEGLRIQVVDSKGKPMFPSGSARMYERTRKLMEQVGKVVQAVPNEISVRGHTDSVPYGANADYTNWELSSDRANASRRALKDTGVPSDRLNNVVGKADTEHLLPEDPTNARNRRISIVLLREELTDPEAYKKRVKKLASKKRAMTNKMDKPPALPSADPTRSPGNTAPSIPEPKAKKFKKTDGAVQFP